MIFGSRNHKGQTARAGIALIEGLKSEKIDVEELFLPEMKIEKCRQCNDDGWGDCRKKGTCIIDDDFQTIRNKIKKSDGVVFANPVYYSTLSESLRAFLDRLRRTLAWDKNDLKGKPVIGICVAGGGGGGAPSCIVSLEHVLNNCGFDVLDLIPARRQNLDLKIDILKTTGKWFAKKLAKN